MELPSYRRENGLWAHQKFFIKLAFEAHKTGGARYVLADQVGLGKTVQLALAAKLMALYGDRLILILVPKPLMIQWQEELWKTSGSLQPFEMNKRPGGSSTLSRNVIPLK